MAKNVCVIDKNGNAVTGKVDYADIPSSILTASTSRFYAADKTITVTENGEYDAKEAGKIVVSVSTSGGGESTREITLNNSALEVYSGDTTEFQVNVTPANAMNRVTWTVSGAITKQSESGENGVKTLVVTAGDAQGIGYVRVLVDGTEYGKCTINVKEASQTNPTTPTGVVTATGEATSNSSQKVTIVHNLGTRKLLLYGFVLDRYNSDEAVTINADTGVMAFFCVTPGVIPSEFACNMNAPYMSSLKEYKFDQSSDGLGITYHDPYYTQTNPYVSSLMPIYNGFADAPNGGMINVIDDNKVELTVRIGNRGFKWFAMKLE